MLNIILLRIIGRSLRNRFRGLFQSLRPRMLRICGWKTDIITLDLYASTDTVIDTIHGYHPAPFQSTYWSEARRRL